MAATFVFDSSYCTGCKACQAACKDRNQLPVGVLWRRVYEISGAGNWVNEAGTWSTDVYAYNISMACNHCEHPKCAGVCPTGAYSIRGDGIVVLDTQRCTGCGYCGWACPYGAPQFDDLTGTMTKCNFCVEDLDAGQTPACVAACPMRVLDKVDWKGQEVMPGYTQQVPPLPEAEARNPRFFIKPHPAVEQSKQGEAHIANQEEIQTRLVGRFEEGPLVAFTLLAQMAVGAFIIAGLLGLFNWISSGADLFENSTMSLYSVGAVLLISLLISFSHLGRPGNAWRVLANLRKSWLSREILFTSLFGVFWAMTTFLKVIHTSGFVILLSWVGTSLSGLAAIWSMAQVYRLKTVPAWEPRQTTSAFFTASFLLGSLWVGMLYSLLNPETGDLINEVKLIGITGAMIFILALVHSRSKPSQAVKRFNKVRQGLIAAGIIGSILLIWLPAQFTTWTVLAVFLTATMEEVLGRISFYESRIQEF